MPDSSTFEQPEPSLTALANAAGSDPAAGEAFLEAIYKTLQGWTRSRIRNDPAGNLLGATALVHEIYSSLFLDPFRRRQQWNDRNHFFAVFGEALRHAVADHARYNGRTKRGGGWRRTEPADEGSAVDPGFARDAVAEAVQDAVGRLQERYPEACEVVRLKHEEGLTNEQTAARVGVSVGTVKTRWRLGLSFMRAVLDGDGRGLRNNGAGHEFD